MLGNFSINAACDIFLSVPDTLSIRDILLIDGDSKLIIDLMLSANLFSSFLLSIPDKLSTRFDS